MSHEFAGRPLIFVAHPDDESLACGGLLQRLPASLVVFACNGAPGGFGLEREFGSLKKYSELRFEEASRVFRHVPNSSFKRLGRTDGSYFGDMHLFEGLPDAATSLRTLAESFSPDAIISHAYEGAHIDHDACSFLAMHVAAKLSLKRFEFPLYWINRQGRVVLQQFRDVRGRTGKVEGESAVADVLEWRLSEAEIECKKKMLAEYRTQRGTVAKFSPAEERMRVANSDSASFSIAMCRDYMYQNLRPRFYHTRHHRISAKVLLKKFAEFEDWRNRGENWR